MLQGWNSGKRHSNRTTMSSFYLRMQIILLRLGQRELLRLAIARTRVQAILNSDSH